MSTTTLQILPKPPTNLAKKIVLTLDNGLLPESAFKETPSHIDCVDVETETDLRILGCESIQTAGMLLKLPQVAMTTGQIYFQRFYYSKSFVRYPMEAIAMGCIHLASKVEEKPRNIDDVINVFHHMKQVTEQKLISPIMIGEQKYYKEEVIKAERRILKELGFCVHIKQAYKLLIVYLQLLQYEKHHQLAQTAWNYMTDALRTDVYMRFPPETIACACIYLSARKIALPLPNDPHWFLLLKVTEEDIRKICTGILKLYKRAKVNPEELKDKLDRLRRAYQATKQVQPQKEQENTKSEDKKEESPTASNSSSLSSSSSSKETSRRESEKEMSPKTPSLPPKYNRSRESKRERSRSPYDRRRKYSNKSHTSRQRDRELYRSREGRRHEKRSRDRSTKYDSLDRNRTRSSRDGRDKRRRY